MKSMTEVQIKIREISELKKYLCNMALVLATAHLREYGFYKCVIDNQKVNIKLMEQGRNI